MYWFARQKWSANLRASENSEAKRREPAFGSDLRSGIEANRVLGLAGVEVTYVVDARARDGVEDVLGKVAVGVDDRHSLACDDIGHGKVKEERRFSRALFADDPDTALPLFAGKYNAAAVRGGRNDKRLCLHIVALAPGDDTVRQRGSRLPSCARPYLWRSG